MPVSGFAHACIGSRDLAATERYYCEGLGAKRLFRFTRGGAEVGFYLALPDGKYIEVFARDTCERPDHPPLAHLCLETPDIDALGRRRTLRPGHIDALGRHMRGLGYDFSEKRMGADHSWQAWSEDPVGVRLEFHEYTDESCQRTGADCPLD